jgi:hypothetical protein
MRRATIALVAVAVVGSACGKKSDPAGPVSGDLVVSYNGPSDTDGALLLSVSGAVTAVKAVGGYQVASAPAGPTLTRVVVTGTLAAGDLFKITVPDVSLASTYSIHIDAAADRATFALTDVIAYTATARK